MQKHCDSNLFFEYRSVPFEYIRLNLNHPWRWDRLSGNLDIPWKFIISHKWLNWEWFLISSHPQLDLTFIVDNLNFDWDWLAISSHSNITWELIVKNKHLPWKTSGVSINPNINKRIIELNPHIFWDYWVLITLGVNKNLLLKYENEIDFINLSYHPCLTQEIIDLFPNKNWDHTFLKTRNVITNNKTTPQQTIRTIQKSPTKSLNMDNKYKIKPWDYQELSQNPNLTFDYIANNLDKNWDWSKLLRNPLSQEKAKWINYYRISIISSLRIQRYWRLYSCDPNYLLAQRLIIKKISN